MVWWMKSEHIPEEPIALARGFLQKLRAQQFDDAFEVSVKRGFVGHTPDELRTVAERELCSANRWVSISPFQSNGNRLRRLLLAREIEMPQVQVEFEGGCLLGVTVRRQKGGGWRVYRFASHAG
jgi:hypothetical protein